MISATDEQERIDALKRAEVALGRFRRWPSFEPVLEQQYEAYSLERRNRTLRFWLLFGLVLRVLGLATEFSIGGDMPVYGLVFRLGILAPVVLVSLWFLSPRYSVLTQGIAATAAPFLCVVGLALLGAAAPHPTSVVPSRGLRRSSRRSGACVRRCALPWRRPTLPPRAAHRSREPCCAFRSVSRAFRAMRRWRSIAPPRRIWAPISPTRPSASRSAR